MNSLGKVLVAIICLLSIAFFILAALTNATHVNWYDVAMGPNGLKKRVEDAERINAELREQLNVIQLDMKREQIARQASLAALQTALASAESARSSSEAEAVKLQGQTQAQSVALEANSKQLQELNASNTQLKSQLNEARTNFDAAFLKAVEVTDKLNVANGTKATLEERNSQLANDVTKYKELTDSLGKNVDDPIDGTPPNVNGEVLAVGKDMIEISLGYDDGLREGHVLEVSRGGAYLGRVLVKKIDPDRAAAEVLREFRQGLIKKGDRVDTIIQ
jgi:myosin heavy subunit